jgi:gluconokinase
VIFVVMGVSGSGKSTVGRALAERLGVPYAEGDDLHPAANREKMASGQPLTDEDRWPWLRLIAGWIGEHAEAGGVVTCSALKRAYRDLLRDAAPGEVVFVHLAGDRELIGRRIGARTGHFMPPALLDSQFAALEPLAGDEPGVTVDVALSPEVIVDRVTRGQPRG